MNRHDTGYLRTKVTRKHHILDFGSDGRRKSLLEKLGEQGISSVMVEGGPEVSARFLRQRQAQRVVLTIDPTFTGGTPALDQVTSAGKGERLPRESLFPRLKNVRHRRLGEHLIAGGEPGLNVN